MLILKRGEVLIHQEKDQLLISVVRNMWDNSLYENNNCYGCEKGVHMVKYRPNVRSQGKRNNQDQSTNPSSEAPKRNHLYALKARGEQESFPMF